MMADHVSTHYMHLDTVPPQLEIVLWYSGVGVWVIRLGTYRELDVGWIPIASVKAVKAGGFTGVPPPNSSPRSPFWPYLDDAEINRRPLRSTMNRLHSASSAAGYPGLPSPGS
jgi:hypothetical protein